MGEQTVENYSDPASLRLFVKAVLNDLRALEHMIDSGMIESGVRRIGAEQEVFLVDDHWQPAPLATQILDRLDDPQYTPELGRFNLEFNLHPISFGTDCLSKMEHALSRHVAKLREVAAEFGAKAVLTGILPTLKQSDMGLQNMMPLSRYAALNEAIKELRGGDFEFHVAGIDELIIKHDSVLLEACNTSCQVHFQTGPEEFAKLYNVAQAVAAPVLALAANSPVLFGRRLWAETRIALFQQSIDTRLPGRHLEDRRARVSFGDGWVKNSVLEIFREDVSRFRAIIGMSIDEDPFEEIAQGRAPRLKALQLHNGTVYRWNRACYGISEGKPHLRIENRVLPSGPTILDEVANAAFWFGLMSGVSHTYPDITKVIEFDTIKSNFLSAARYGLEAQFTWIDDQTAPAEELIRHQLLPLARDGLERAKINQADIDRYLGVVEARAACRRNGSKWILRSLASMKDKGTSAERFCAITAAMHTRQQTDEPAHEWSLARLEEGGGWKHNYLRVEQIMNTNLFSVHEDDVIDLVANMMDWRRIRHVPVEDNSHRLVGLVSYRALLRVLARDMPHGQDNPLAVRDIMQRKPITISPDMPTTKAIATMRNAAVSCLPVVEDGRLVGLVNESDFVAIAGQLLEDQLREV